MWQRAQQRLKAAYENSEGSRLVMKSKDPVDKDTFATWEWDLDPSTRETKERNAWIHLRQMRGEVFDIPTKVSILKTIVDCSYIYWAYWIAGFQASPYRLSGSEPAHCKRSCYHHGILVRGVLSFTLYTHIILPQATPSCSYLEKVVDDSDEMAEAEKIATLEAERLRLLKVCLEMQVFQVVITPHSCR